ncbi:MAG: aminotransferase class I/II-fold pyridoxal phosphate-dependent enzyme [Phycisphaerales bacterium]|nr:aminotransferase class I/II-fold pyridoxal phosphate-dependent enzyme [Phycisphaerales bacterium]
MDIDRLLSARARSIDASGIRRVFELGAKLKDPINLSIGQPDFAVPDEVKRGAIDAIRADRNGYTVTQGIPELRARIEDDLHRTLGWPKGEYGVLVTSGTSGALFLAAMALLGGDDEMVIPDPYFVLYPNLAKLFGGRAVLCDTYPEFKMTAARAAPLLTDRTRFVLNCSPGNPTGVTMSEEEQFALHDLCRERGGVLVSDEIYDRFVFPPFAGAAPTPCRARAGCERPWDSVLLVRGFGKTYGATGWRIGYAAGPKRLIEEMTKLQQYTYVCAPSMAQWGALAAFDADISGLVGAYARRRDRVVERLSEATDLAAPTGAFYAFPRVPERLGQTAKAFVERAIDRGVLIIPGNVFSARDTHFRLSFATDERTLDRGLDVIVRLMKGG